MDQSHPPQDGVTIRHSLTSPGVTVYDYPLLEAESKKIDELIVKLDAGVASGFCGDLDRDQIHDVLDIIFLQADVEEIVRRCLLLDPQRLEEDVQRLLYLFAIGRTGLLRVTDDYGEHTTESAALLETHALIDQLPGYVAEWRASGDYRQYYDIVRHVLVHVDLRREGASTNDGGSASGATVALQRTPKAPAVQVKNYELIEAEAKFFADVLGTWNFDGYNQESDVNANAKLGNGMIQMLLSRARVDDVVRDSLQLEPERLNRGANLILYLFAIGRTNLLRPVDDEGRLTTDVVAVFELEQLLDRLPKYIATLQAEGAYLAVDAYFLRILARTWLPTLGSIATGPAPTFGGETLWHSADDAIEA